MADIKEFKLEIPFAQIDALKAKLATAVFPDELEDSGWNYGSPLADIVKLKTFWEKEFDFNRFQENINRLPQYTTKIAVDGFGALDIHFVHQKSRLAPGRAIPLIFVHGWPGSFYEVHKLLPLLAHGDGVTTPAYDIVAPSLPNFGFSEGVTKKGFDITKYAEVMNKLMLKLGYNEYVTQGGDWGYMITRSMALLYPQHVKASHINLARPLGPPKFLSNPLLWMQEKFTAYSQLDKQLMKRGVWFATEGTGYNKLQSTCPQTLMYALVDSPLALLAWHYEKYHNWTDSYNWTLEEICTWVSIYQFARSGPGANVRIYYEASHPSNPSKIGRDTAGEYIPNVPLGISRFPMELNGSPSTWNGTMAPKVVQSNNEHGGHFAATEHPEVLVRDLNKMFSPGGVAFECCGRSKSGFQQLGKPKL